MPDVQAPPEEWADQAAAIAAWATPRKTEAVSEVEFGCIIGQEATGKSRFLPWWLWSLVTERDPDTLVIYAADDIRAGRLLIMKDELKQGGGQEPRYHTYPWHTTLVGEARARQPRPPRHELAVGSYTAVGRMLKGNVDRLDPNDPDRKDQDDAEASWDCIGDDLMLPARVVLLVDIEPSWPASLAFLLTAALTWALPEGWGRCPAKSVRLLGVSSAEPPTCFEDLLLNWRTSLGRNRGIHGFILPGTLQPPHARSPVRCVAQDDLEGVIRQATAEVSRGEPQAVVSWIEGLECGADITVPLDGPLWHDVSDAKGRDARLVTDAEWALGGMVGICGDHPRVLYSIPEPRLVPAHLTGYSAVHLVLPSVRLMEILDSRTRLAMFSDVTVSRRERSHMLSWAGRTTTDQAKVFIYLVDSKALTAEQWVAEGAEEQRALVAGPQLEGFMASLASLCPWVRAPLLITMAFSPATHVVDRMRRQLRVHGVAIWHRQGGDCTIEVLLPGGVFPVFLDCLQFFRYDIRLAVLAATPSSTPRVARVKCMLASMMSVRMLEMMDFRLLDSLDRRLQHQGILEAVGKWLARPVISSGLIWTCLALWSAASATGYSPKKGGQFPATEAGGVIGKVIQCQTADAIHDALIVTLKPHGVEVAMPDRLVRAEYTELQRCLLSAYAYHLVLLQVPEWGPSQASAYIYSAGDSVEVGLSAKLSVDVDEGVERYRQCTFGLSSLFLRDQGQSSICDWTRIPLDVLLDWLEGQHTSDLEELLHGEEPCFNNPDEPR